MSRVSFTLRGIALASSFGLCLGLLTGCTHMVENRVISAFATAIEANDAEGLKKIASSDFEQKALRREKSLEAMKINLDIPTADLKIIKVIDENEARTSKRVQVEVGETSRKVWYRLKQEASGTWVVDDVFLDKRELANGQSVAARLDLILSLQTFLESWDKEEDAFRKCLTADFAEVLFRLPEAERNRMLTRLGGPSISQENLRPDLALLEDTAECRLSRANSDLTIKFEKVDGLWLVTDLAVDAPSAGEDVASVRNMARAILASMAFHDAYSAGDKTALQKLTSRRFFDGSLMAADLSIVTLPGLDQDKDGPEVAVESTTASFLLQTPKEVIRFGLVQDTTANPKAPEYKVDDVTLYELESNQNKRLSAMFTAHAVMLLFHDALIRKSLKELQLNASHDFNTRVWKRVNEELLDRLPLDRTPQEAVEVVTARFQGSVTSITLTSGDQPLTYVLRDEQGKVLVDDVQIPTPGQPDSLKTTCDVLIPAFQMLDALEAGRMDAVRGSATREFNRLVWNQLGDVPDLPGDLSDHLQPGLRDLAAKPDRCQAIFGDGKFGARIELIKEGEFFRVDDLVFVTGPEASQHVGLKHALRARIQSGELSPTPKTALAPEP